METSQPASQVGPEQQMDMRQPAGLSNIGQQESQIEKISRGQNQQVPLGEGGAQHLPPGSFGGDGGDQGVYSHHYSGGRTRRDQPAQALHQYENQFNPQVGCQGVEIQRPRMVEVINNNTVRDNQTPVGEGSGRAPTGEQDSTWAYSDVSTLSITKLPNWVATCQRIYGGRYKHTQAPQTI